VFCVDEVIVYNDGTVPSEEQGGISEPNTFLAHILQFLETPQYLLLKLANEISSNPSVPNAS
jgi:predicted SPOUT superfamily RNA methylase MTH1